ncbi:Chromosomal replication initiator protein DnaA [Hartmannibacter diazotrophicus]|uniref:Chromosomal replication initiator protein DnaA n=1 Tax=Hartmannibacter diazotrophicus TaxID=1482074 RepID=A0A2C9CZM1_9HYPH|nr:chromosomal replication initiator protein DnaA [Hartmannibacter diazotrophicus]SON53542.1 Chromosomal replication initiator protein DnaA [Hartmannibacter diazotrophicus]
MEAAAGNKAKDAWACVRARLLSDLGDEVFSCWFAGMKLESIENGIVTHSVPSRFLKSWISTYYRDKLAELWKSESGQVRKIDVVVRTPIVGKVDVVARSAAKDAAAPENARPVMAARDVVQPMPRPAAPQAVQHSSASAQLVEEAGSPLDPRFTLASFVEGGANSFALAAARQVAAGPGATGVSFNPLFIHASVGLGKTHLLQAVANEIRVQRPDVKVLYLTAEQFMYRFVQALQSQSAIAFKDALRGIDVLLIDDVQFLHGKQLQQEFCHTVNSLIDGSRQVVVAADRPPIELETLDERVRSRLAGGLLVEISEPDQALRRAIVDRRIEVARLQHPDFTVPAEVVDFIVRNVTTSGRDLEGAVTRLVGHNQLTGAPISLAMAEATLRDLVRATDTRKVKIEDIQRIVSKHFNVSKQDLLSSRRTRSIVWPRQIAMYLAKSMTPRSLPEIGRRFGGRDHTTVLHAVRKVEDIVQNDDTIAQEIEILRRMLEN